MDIENSPGISECLQGTHSIDEAVVKDPGSNAWVLPAGGGPLNTSDLPDSVKMVKLLHKLSNNFDLILIDSPPVLAVADTLFLSRLADRTVLIARWGKTRRQEINLALKRLRNAQCEVAGVVLSMVKVKEHIQYGFEDAGAFHAELKKYYAG